MHTPMSMTMTTLLMLAGLGYGIPSAQAKELVEVVTTPDAIAIELHDDGSWSYQGTAPEAAPPRMVLMTSSRRRVELLADGTWQYMAAGSGGRQARPGGQRRPTQPAASPAAAPAGDAEPAAAGVPSPALGAGLVGPGAKLPSGAARVIVSDPSAEDLAAALAAMTEAGFQGGDPVASLLVDMDQDGSKDVFACEYANKPNPGGGVTKGHCMVATKAGESWSAHSVDSQYTDLPAGPALQGSRIVFDYEGGRYLYISAEGSEMGPEGSFSEIQITSVRTIRYTGSGYVDQEHAREQETVYFE